MAKQTIDLLKNAMERCRDIQKKTGRNPYLTFCSMLYAYLTMKMRPSEYQSSSYYQLTSEQRQSYIPSEDYYKMVLSVTTPKGEKILNDKRETLKRLATLSGRQWLDLSHSSYEEFQNFVTRHRKIVIKAHYLRFGEQITVHENLIETVPNLRAFYEDLIEKKLYLIEEFVVQHKALSEIYPHCVNTIRLHTARCGSDVRICLLPSLKVGSGGQTIDSGDLTYTVLLDEKGIACSDAIFNRTKEDHICFHPDTGVPFRSIHVPFWNEVEALVKEAALRMEESVFIGWDIAISDRGPVIIEGNAVSGFVGTYQQFLLDLYGHGCREEIEEIFRFIKGDSNSCTTQPTS